MGPQVNPDLASSPRRPGREEVGSVSTTTIDLPSFGWEGRARLGAKSATIPPTLPTSLLSLLFREELIEETECKGAIGRREIADTFRARVARTHVSRSRARGYVCTAVALLIALLSTCAYAEPVEVTGVCFSPRGGCTALVVHELEQAKRQVRVLAYSFTSDAIADALVAAAKRGVDVQVVLDKSNRTGRYTDAPELDLAHVPVTIDAAHAIAHNKVIVIDGETVLTGSFNFTVAAEAHNAENMLVLRSAELATQYLANWQLHRQHARPYARRPQ